MADLTKTIEIIFGATDNTGGALKNIASEFDNLGDFAGNIADPFAGLGKNILAVETAMVSLGAAVVVYSTTQAVKMESAQKSLIKVLGESETDIDGYTESIKNLSLSFGVSGIAATDSVTAFKQAGFTIEESLGLVETSLTAVKIAELGADEAASLLIATIRGTGSSAEDAAHFMDAWNEASNNYATSAKEVAIATAALAPLADSAGLSFDKMVGLTVPMIEVLGSGSEAANTLKVSLANLTSDSSKVTDTLSAIGIAQKDANGEFRSANDILDDLGAAWPALSKSQQANYAQLLFGKEQYARMLIVLNDYNKVLEVTEASESSYGSAQEELQIALAKTETQIERLKVAFQSAAVGFGENFLSETGGVAEGLADISVAISDIISEGGLSPLIDLIKNPLATLEQDLKQIAQILPEAFAQVDFSLLVRSFENLGEEMSDVLGLLLGEGIDLTTPKGLVTALQKAVDILAALTNVSAGIIQEFAPIFDALGKLSGKTGEFSEDTQEAVGNFLGAAILISDYGLALGGFVTAIKETDSNVGTVLTNIDAAGRVIINTLQIAFDAFAAVVFNTLAKISASLSVVTFGDLSDSFEAAFADLTLLGNGATANMERNALELKDAFESFGTNMFAGTAVEKAAQGVVDSTGKVVDAVEDAGAATDAVTSGSFTPFSEELENQADVTEDVVDKQGELIKSTIGVGEAQKDAAIEIKKTGEQVISYKERLEGLSRIYEAKVSLDIAQAEADASKFASLMEAMGETSKAIGQGISAAFDFLGGENFDNLSKAGQVEIIDVIQQQGNAQYKLAESQARLADAQAAIAEAKAASLRDGQALIQIDGTNLAPELELIMFKVLESIQIRAAEEQADFLLGIGEV